MFVGYALFVAVRLLPGLPYRARAIMLSAASFLAAGSAVLLRGLAPAPVLLIGLGVLISSLFLGRAGMFGSLLMAGAIVGLAGRPEPNASFNSWSSAIDVVCVAGVLTVLVQFVVSRLEGSVERSSRALEQLRSEQALREQAQNELTRAQATLLQTQKLDAVGKLAGGVAHDFNNTLQIVLGWAELLRHQTQPQQMHEGIEQIRVAAERSRGLTRQLLTFSRPDMRTPTRVELQQFLPELIKSFRRLLPADISIVVRPADGLAILMDEGHLSQVILNIVLNARDAMPNGGTVAVITRSVPQDELPPAAAGFAGDAVAIEITDTGAGMDEEMKSRAFEPFFTTKGHRGTGLGLSTVYGVVQQADGVIDIESAPGKGTSVKLFFPPLTGGGETQPDTEPHVSPRSDRQVVLLAEDDRDVRATLAQALRQAGHRVVDVGDVDAGRVVIRKQGAEFGVLVTDGIMPGGSTRQLIDDYLLARPNGRVVVCSGYIDDELSMRDLSARSFEFVPKPFLPSELVARLDSAEARSR
jgi:signal transduction histidine kinase/CheY-like chemotaxis protein